MSVIGPVNSSENLTNQEKVIVVLGDSLSAGYGVRMEEAWPSLLEKKINASGIKVRIINAGISGDTTSGGLYRLPKLINAHTPDLIILELGGNDGLRGMSIKKVIKKNLDTMINIAREASAEVALIGVELPPNYGPSYTMSFKNMYVELSRQYELTLIQGSIQEMVRLNYMQADGIHPNPEGHQMIEAEVRSKILPLLTNTKFK